MIHVLCAAALATCFAAPCFAKSAPSPKAPPAPCLTIEQSRAVLAEIVSKGSSLKQTDLDGEQAGRFLAVINGIGKPTNFMAAHISVVTKEDAPMARIYIGDGKCGGFSTVVTTSAGAEHAAYLAAIEAVSL